MVNILQSDVGVSVFGLEASANFGMVFSAKPENPKFTNGRQITDQFLGFMFGIGISQNGDPTQTEVPIEPDCAGFSRSCGYVRKATNTSYSECNVNGIDDVKKAWNEVGLKARDDLNI